MQPPPPYGGYGGYGAQPGPYYPAYMPLPKTNGLAVASLVLSIVGAIGVFCLGVGLLPAAVGTIMGHVARRQIRQRGDAGAGLALAGIIVGWLVIGLAVLFIAWTWAA